MTLSVAAAICLLFLPSPAPPPPPVREAQKADSVSFLLINV